MLPKAKWTLTDITQFHLTDFKLSLSKKPIKTCPNGCAMHSSILKNNLQVYLYWTTSSVVKNNLPLYSGNSCHTVVPLHWEVWLVKYFKVYFCSLLCTQCSHGVQKYRGKQMPHCWNNRQIQIAAFWKEFQVSVQILTWSHLCKVLQSWPDQLCLTSSNFTALKDEDHSNKNAVESLSSCYCF